MTWKSSPETAIEHPNGDRIKVSWSDLITVEICCTYAGGADSDDEDVAVSIDVTALPHLLLALQHCMDVARLEGCFDEESR